MATQSETAAALGITRNAVYKIEQRIVEKFKNALALRCITVGDLLPDHTKVSEWDYIQPLD